MLERHGVERLPGAHCYGFLTGNTEWEELHDAEPATFYLTDFLARHFDALVIRGLGLDRHPELLEQYFGNYRRLLYLAQTDDEDLRRRARAAAERLGLEYEERRTGYGDLLPRSRASSRRRPLPELTVIWWRDIPAQVTAKDGRESARAQLTERFQEAIDAAAMRAGLIGRDAYLGEWRREARDCGDDLETEVAEEAEWLEAAYPDDTLARLVNSDGFDS